MQNDAEGHETEVSWWPGSMELGADHVRGESLVSSVRLDSSNECVSAAAPKRVAIVEPDGPPPDNEVANPLPLARSAADAESVGPVAMRHVEAKRTPMSPSIRCGRPF